MILIVVERGDELVHYRLCSRARDLLGNYARGERAESVDLFCQAGRGEHVAVMFAYERPKSRVDGDEVGASLGEEGGGCGRRMRKTIYPGSRGR